MSQKLTKEQKRAKKKRDERKLSQTRQHEENRQYKRFEAMAHLFFFGDRDNQLVQADVDSAILGYAGVKSNSIDVSEHNCKHNSWNKTTSLISSLFKYKAIANKFAETPSRLAGRVFFVSDEVYTYSSIYAPLELLFTSHLVPEELLSEMMVNLHDHFHHAIYSFGVSVGLNCINLAIINSRSNPDVFNVFYICNETWMPLNYDKWSGDIWPVIVHSALRNIDAYTITGEAMMDLLRYANKENKNENSTDPTFDDGSEPKSDPDIFLSVEQRKLIGKICNELMTECENIVFASKSEELKCKSIGFSEGWNKAAELYENKLRDKMKDSCSSTASSVVGCNCDLPALPVALRDVVEIPSVGLPERMSALFELV